MPERRREGHPPGAEAARSAAHRSRPGRDPACRGICGAGSVVWYRLRPLLRAGTSRRNRARPAGGLPRGGWRHREPCRGGAPLSAGLGDSPSRPWCRRSRRAPLCSGRRPRGRPAPPEGCPARAVHCGPAPAVHRWPARAAHCRPARAAQCSPGHAVHCRPAHVAHCRPAHVAPCRPVLSTPLCAYRHDQPLPPFARRPPPGRWPLLSG